jgi:hypothetical protein
MQGGMPGTYQIAQDDTRMGGTLKRTSVIGIRNNHTICGCAGRALSKMCKVKHVCEKIGNGAPGFRNIPKEGDIEMRETESGHDSTCSAEGKRRVHKHQRKANREFVVYLGRIVTKHDKDEPPAVMRNLA